MGEPGMLRPTPESLEWAQTRDDLVWSVCRYLKTSSPTLDCNRCPHIEDDPDYGPCHRMCRGLAEETVAIVHFATIEAIVGSPSGDAP